MGSGIREIPIPVAEDYINRLINDREHNLIVDDKGYEQSEDEIIKMLFELMDDYYHPAAQCLRCYLSYKIKYICYDLHHKRSNGKFEVGDLFPNALEESLIELGKKPSEEYTSLAVKILSTYKPSSGSKLSSWAYKLTKTHKNIRLFLESHNIPSQTDRGILRETTERKISYLGEYVDEKKVLFICFNAVYNRDLGKGHRGRICPPYLPEQLQEMCYLYRLKMLPTYFQDINSKYQNSITEKRIQAPLNPEQVRQICNLLGDLSSEDFYSAIKPTIVISEIEFKDICKLLANTSPANIESKLKDLASEIREYKSGGNKRPKAVKKDLEHQREDIVTSTSYEFYEYYLHQAIRMIAGKYSRNEKKSQYLRAIKTYLCSSEKISQVNVANLIGKSSNSDVSRQLKEFRLEILNKTIALLVEDNKISAEICSDHGKHRDAKKEMSKLLGLEKMPSIFSCAVCQYFQS